MTINNLDQIQFDETDDRFDEPGLRLKGVFVPKREFVLMYRMANRSIPDLIPGVRYTAREIFRDPSWDGFPLGKRIALGRVLCFFVEERLLLTDLVVAKTRKGKPYKGGSLRYVLYQPNIAKRVKAMEMSPIRTVRNQELLAHVDWAALH
jgi:hypothetical protein